MKTKILIVEDSKIISEHYSKKLSLLNYGVETAFDGVECLKKIRDFKPDIIILDYDIPKKTGMDVLRDIKNSPKMKNIYVIMFTVYGFEDEIRQAEKLGVDKFVCKPIKPNKMIQLIENAEELLNKK